jgi:hypothetical protein
MNTMESDITVQPTQTHSPSILYFRFRPDVGHAIQQVEYDLLQTYLSEHRGHADDIAPLCHDGYWAVMATSETGIGADAVEYTTNYLRSMPVVAELSITTVPPPPNPSQGSPLPGSRHCSEHRASEVVWARSNKVGHVQETIGGRTQEK